MSYTVSNEERSLNPVGRAITTDNWGDPIFPRYFVLWFGLCHAIALFCKERQSQATRQRFYPKPFAWEPVRYSVFKVLHKSIPLWYTIDET